MRGLRALPSYLLSSLSERTSKTSLPPVAEDVRHFVTLLCPYTIPYSSLRLFILSPPFFSSLCLVQPSFLHSLLAPYILFPISFLLSHPSIPNTSLNLSCCLYPSLPSSTLSFNLLPLLPPPFFPHSPSPSPSHPPPPPPHS